MDTTLTGEINIESTDIEVINPQDMVDGGIGMDPSYLEYLQELKDR
jgi:hypothetical protein